MIIYGDFEMGNVPQYTKDAINRYNAKFDRIAVNLPKGTKDKIKELTGKSCNAYISALVLAELEKLEHKNNKSYDELPECFR